MNHIGTCNHPESYLTGSTVSSMIKRSKELGLPYFAVTDNGYMSCSLKAYSYAKKSDIKPILGIEIFFKDPNCPMALNTPSQNVKYFKLVIHALDQPAYQKLVKMCSNTQRTKMYIGDHKFYLWTWADLEDLSKFNVTVSNSNVEDIVTKHLLVNSASVGMQYYQRLLELFKDNFYPSIVPYKHNQYWSETVEVQLNGKKYYIPANDRIETDYFEQATAIELTRRGNKHKKLLYIYINKVRYKVAEPFQDIHGAKLINTFRDMPTGDIQTKANKFIMALAQKFGQAGKLLINNYAYYSEKEDKIVQNMRLGGEKQFQASQYICSTEDIKEYLITELGFTDKAIEKTVQNSYQWAERFKDFELKYSYRLPEVDGNPEQLLIDIIKKKGRMKWDNPQYVQQFREEFDLLTKNGVINLIPYFLPIEKIFDFYAKSGFLTGPARGSAGGFLISYLAGITHLDPIKYGLSSARFLTLDRIQQGNYPDIDADFESRTPLVGQDGNSGYLYKTYGKRVAQASTRTLLRIKSAILDANRFINGGKVDDLVAAFSKSLPNTPQGVNDNEYVFGYEDNEGTWHPGLLETNDDLQKYATERPKEWDIVKRALSLSRQNSRHACSYLIADCDIEDILPVFEIGGVNRVTQPEAKQCEEAKLIKYDFLVVQSLKDIRFALDYINAKKTNEPQCIGWQHPESGSYGCKQCDPEMFKEDGWTEESGDGCLEPICLHDQAANLICPKCNKTIKDCGTIETGYFLHNGTKTYIWDLPEDQNVFKMLGSGKTESVFQLNTQSVTPFVKRLQPKSILDCATITSLVRPGPLDFIDEKTGRNMAEEYVARNNGTSRGHLEILNQMLPETHGIIVFQEQVSRICRELAGMSVIDSENVRIAMGKKKKKLIDSLKPVFIEGATIKVGRDVATEIWSMMETFARYGFNKSHAVGYSVISYACAFLKYHYPLEWWAAVLSNAKDKEIKEVFYQYTRDMVLPPDINLSTEKMSIDYNLNKIRNKLSMIVGVGAKLANKIIEGRPYKSIQDFANKKVCGSAIARKLIHVGVLDSLFDPKDSLLVKMKKFEDAVIYRDYLEKLNSYDILDPKQVKLKEKYEKKGPAASKINDLYIGMTPLKDFQIKKSIFPTMNLDLTKIFLENYEGEIHITPQYPVICNNFGEEFPLLTGEQLQKIDETNITQYFRFCVLGYIINAEEFAYSNGSKKALKIVVDSSGYTSEKVLWPDYDTGILSYPPELKAGAVCCFFYYKKPDKPYTNIIRIQIKAESI
ncbi:MAG TPA: PHP domain-containing protein [Patescibacteria group bacterium]|nr:PHP domain-containing protein [Patescibacteria group bacterium]